MANPFQEWAAEEIVETVPEFLDGKRREVPAALVRHQGRVPPKKGNKKSVSPKAMVDIQPFQCEAIEDDLMTESLGAPSPLNLEIVANKPTPRSPNAATMSSPTKSFNSVRASPDNTRGASPATKAASGGAAASGSSSYQNNRNTSNWPRPPTTRAANQLAPNPRQVVSSPINGTPNRLSPVNTTEEPPQASAKAVSSSSATSALKPSPPAPSVGFKRSGNTKSSPSVGSIDDGISGITTTTDSSSRKGTLPFSAPAGQNIPALRRDVSAPTPGQADRSNGRGVSLPLMSYSADVPAPLVTAKEAPSSQPDTRQTAAASSGKPTLLAPAPAGGTGSGSSRVSCAAAPQPASRSRTVPRPTAAAASSAIAVSTATHPGESKLNSTAAAPSKGATAGSQVLPRVGNSGNNGGVAKTAVDSGYHNYTENELLLTAGAAPTVSDHEPRRAKQGGTRNVNSSMMSSAGYSVLRGAYDSHASLEFGSALPSLGTWNATQASTVAGSHVNFSRPPNMMTMNSATALRAKSSFARANSSKRQPQAGGAAVRDSDATSSTPTPAPRASPDNAAHRQSPQRASRGGAGASNARNATLDDTSDSGALGIDDSAHDKHRKRAPQTKRELRRRSTEFEKV